MASRKVIYQTLQDWNNPNDVRDNGPFPCTSDDAWLGDGYYFWDTFLDLAHWWGEAQHNGKYIIVKGVCKFKRKHCFDLQGEPEHMALFISIAKLFESEGYLFDDTTVNEILEYLKENGMFDYKAVRAVGVQSISPTKWPQYSYRLLFNPETKHFIELMPAIQICFYDKNCMDMKDYEIIYPDKHKAA